MLNLMWGYLIIMILLFGANIGLFLGNFNLNNKKTIFVSILFSLFLFLVSFLASNYFKNYFSMISNSINWLFIVVSLSLVIIAIAYLLDNKKNLKPSLGMVTLLFYILIFSVSTQTLGISIFNSLLLALLLFLILFSIYQISKLLFHAKRPFEVIINEFMVFEAIFIFICALTYLSCKDLDYSMFSSFLILTPTYKLVYMTIFLIVLMIVGLYFNDKRMKKKFNK